MKVSFCNSKTQFSLNLLINNLFWRFSNLRMLIQGLLPQESTRKAKRTEMSESSIQRSWRALRAGLCTEGRTVWKGGVDATLWIQVRCYPKWNSRMMQVTISRCRGLHDKHSWPDIDGRDRPGPLNQEADYQDNNWLSAWWLQLTYGLLLESQYYSEEFVIWIKNYPVKKR